MPNGISFNRLAFRNVITPDPRSDAELLDAYRQGQNLSTLGLLYARYMDLVYGVCLQYLMQPDDAQDAVMNIFEELLQKLPRHEVESFRPWLYTVARNHCLMRLRSAKRGGTVSLTEEFVQSADDGHLEAALAREASLVQLEDCLEKLGEHQRRAIDLFYHHGKCYNEIAAETGQPWNQVRSLIQNGRRNLRLCLEARAVKLSAK